MSVTTLEGHTHRKCGGRYVGDTERVTVRLSGMQAEVDRGFFRCDRCGEVQRTLEQRDAAEKGAIEAIRAAHTLLTPREIRQLREGLGLTVQQVADLCYGTPRGIVEGWEKGRYLQNREADRLLRSLTDRDTLVARAARAGVTLPEQVLLAGVMGTEAPAEPIETPAV
jgi:putative zinc finger/helix-turn-helix YgiT family protein